MYKVRLFVMCFNLWQSGPCTADHGVAVTATQDTPNCRTLDRQHVLDFCTFYVGFVFYSIVNMFSWFCVVLLATGMIL
jgi:hypothetical protein